MFDFSFANILHSNLINFLIMIALFAVIIYKLNVGQKLEDMRASIQEKVEESDRIKEEAEKDFKNVSESLANVDDEISTIVDKAKEAAKSYEKKAKADLDNAVAMIKSNAEKQIQTEQNHAKSSLMSSIALSSVEAAERQIKSALDKNKQLHRKYIEEFINSIDKADV